MTRKTLRILLLPLMAISIIAVAAAPPQAAQSSARRAIVIPAGISFRVRTIDAIDVDATQAGMTFRGSIDDPIMLGGDVIVPRGTNVVMVAAKVQQGGRMT